MKEALKKSFEVLLKNGEYAEAEKLLVPYMQANPDDWDAKLLYGTCRMMQGDADTAKLIHQQAQGYFESGKDIPAEQKAFWDKYKKLIFYGVIGTALVLVGVASFKAIEEYAGVLVYSPVKYAGPAMALYAGPERLELHKHKYAGPVRPELQHDETGNDISW